MEVFSDYCYLGENLKDYEKNIITALADNDNAELKNRRVSFAKSHTWEASVNKLYNLINKNL